YDPTEGQTSPGGDEGVGDARARQAGVHAAGAARQTHRLDASSPWNSRRRCCRPATRRRFLLAAPGLRGYSDLVRRPHGDARAASRSRAGGAPPSAVVRPGPSPRRRATMSDIDRLRGWLDELPHLEIALEHARRDRDLSGRVPGLKYDPGTGEPTPESEKRI